MKNIYKILLPLLLALATASCSSLHHAAPAPQATADASLTPVKEQTWQLTAVNGRPLSQNAKPVTLSFNPEANSFRGQTACNSFAGTYSLGSSSPHDPRLPLDIKLLGSGSILCPDADMNAEGRFLALFEKANHLFISTYTLTLYRDSKEILQFELR